MGSGSEDVARALRSVPEEVAANAALDALVRQGGIDEAMELLRKLVREASPGKFSLSEQVLALLVDTVAGSENGEKMIELLPLAGETRTVQAYQSEGLLEEARDRTVQGLPDSGRAADVWAGLAFLLVAVTGLSLEVIDPLIHQSTTLPTMMLLLTGGVIAVDRYYGSGGLYRSVAGGLTRLLSDDLARECRVDAAGFLVAYLVGIPYICFRPNVHEILRNHAALASSRHTVAHDPQLFRNYLTWLLAGVAAEESIDGKLIESDPRSAQELCSAARKSNLVSWNDTDTQSEILTAYTQSMTLLRQYRDLHRRLTQRMLEGATAGECVVLLESARRDSS